MSVPTKLQEQLDLLAMFPDRTGRIEALIALAEGYDSAAAAAVPRTPANQVPGCESEVFLETVPREGKLDFRFAVDNPQGISAMALAEVLQAGLQGAEVAQIAGLDESLVYEIFGKELSMGKSLGLTGMVRLLRERAKACKEQKIAE